MTKLEGVDFILEDLFEKQADLNDSAGLIAGLQRRLAVCEELTNIPRDFVDYLNLKLEVLLCKD